jgi:hypothetical protein
LAGYHLRGSPTPSHISIEETACGRVLSGHPSPTGPHACEYPSSSSQRDSGKVAAEAVKVLKDVKDSPSALGIDYLLEAPLTADA